MNKAKLLIFVIFFTSAFSSLAQASDCYTFIAEGPTGIGSAHFASPAKTLCISMYTPNQYALLFISEKYAQLAEANCIQNEKSIFAPKAIDQQSYLTADKKSHITLALKYDIKTEHFTGSIYVDGKSYPASDLH